MTALQARVAAGALLALSLTGAGLVVSPAGAAPIRLAATAQVVAHHKCTRTSSGSCIRGGEFCPRADYHHSGYDAKGRRYVCKGSHTQPHWELP